MPSTIDAPDQIERRLDPSLVAVRDDIRDIKETLKSLANSMIKLALVEERQAQTAAAQERLFAALAAFEARVAKLEITTANSSRTSKLIDSAMVGTVVFLAMLAANRLGLAG